MRFSFPPRGMIIPACERLSDAANNQENKRTRHRDDSLHAAPLVVSRSILFFFFPTRKQHFNHLALAKSASRPVAFAIVFISARERICRQAENQPDIDSRMWHRMLPAGMIMGAGCVRACAC